ncbi:aminodeoxychorismate/anthranilate synthase component II [Sulfodiicoccus acidiphilus]|uniref:anthranilate synthase n=1 Tax=Sulfodiicoccus acidiphilus TaxID=1670455 RepID=A0A348B3F3_9CREN|nr:aminodeoxychorismate/anthranilate synthase component II [Sulfodiicoccus acidiphilus]BBD72705.1 aminodeoxychorismate/anthranilate synthase component II [Sulfodiicoccus acidiphilus]GGT95388.1 aminodeoxychorismate/anthranilate synthase component II [Sulfodiicoccus acidiphilus]
MDLTLIIDNYDSFVYNIVQAVAELGTRPVVVRNDEISVSGVERMEPDRIIISPGPGTPEKAEDMGIVIDVIRRLAPRLPILGVCLGHQAIGYAFGSTIRKAKRVMHGKLSQVVRRGSLIYQGMPEQFEATRYHSLVVDGVRDPLKINAFSKDDGEVMGIEHVEYRVFGVQFHPESVGTKEGYKVFYNFLNRV